MEKFKAVEKEMKTKAFSKEGLSAAAKLDPKEKEKLETCQFLSGMVEELERQIETLEAEEEALQATAKKGKKDMAKADRLAEIGRSTERHKWYQGKLELLLRSLENGNVETEQVNDIQDSIKYYVEENQAVEFQEDDTIFDDLNLEEDEGAFGMNNDGDRLSSQDTQSVHDDLPDTADGRGTSINKPKSASMSEQSGLATRRPSNQLKSPLPALATLHTPLPSTTNGATTNSMKPAPLPTRPPGETLKYASAAAAAAASDKGNVGIAPLPPPPPGPVVSAPIPNAGLNIGPSIPGPKSSATSSPSVAPSIPTSSTHTPAPSAAIPVAASTDGTSSQAQTDSPALSHSSTGVTNGTARSSAPPPTANPTDGLPAPSKVKAPQTTQVQLSEEPKQITQESALPAALATPPAPVHQPTADQTNGIVRPQLEDEDDESIYHLPPGLQDLIQSFEVTKSRAAASPSPSVHRLLNASSASCPEWSDAERPRHYKPQTKYNTPSHYPQEPHVIIDNPELYSKIDTDTLFYIFYYRQGSYQQHLAAKSLKNQSWRFHKQYQTWFQRHEEPKTITEEFEQGTYRFFDYESTWWEKHCHLSDIYINAYSWQDEPSESRL